MTLAGGGRRGLYLAVLAALLAARFGWAPARDWYEGTVNHVHALEQILQRKGALAGAAAQIAADLEHSGRALAKVSAAYVAGVEDPQALQLHLQEQIEDIAAAAGVTLTRIDWAVPSGGDVIKASVRLDATLPYAHAARFLSALESETPLLYVESLKVVRRPDDRGVDLSTEVSAYGLPLPRKQGGR